jgi:hypothetical protein
MPGRSPAQRELFDILTTGVWITDATLNTKYINPHTLTMLLPRGIRTEGRRAGRDRASIAKAVYHGRADGEYRADSGGGSTMMRLVMEMWR